MRCSPHCKTLEQSKFLYIVFNALSPFLFWITIQVEASSKPTIFLVLPRQATISLVDGRSISGVRLTSLDHDNLTFTKGGKRSLPLIQVKRISFAGPVQFLQRRLKPPRGDEPKGCREHYQLKTNNRVLSVHDSGEMLAIDPDGLESLVFMNLQGPSSRKKLVVSMVRFDSDARVLIEYKSCS